MKSVNRTSATIAANKEKFPWTIATAKTAANGEAVMNRRAEMNRPPRTVRKQRSVSLFSSSMTIAALTKLQVSASYATGND